MRLHTPLLSRTPCRQLTRTAATILMLIAASLISTSVQSQTFTNPPAVIEAAYIKSSNSEAGDLFGFAVDIHDDLMVLSGENEDSNSRGVNGIQSNNSASESGAVYLFRKAAGVWSQEAYLKASNTNASDQFGHDVAVSGDLVAVTAISESSNAQSVGGSQSNNSANRSGAVYLFRRTAGVWQQEAYIKSSNSEAVDQFGWSIALDGNRLVASALLEDGGSAGINGNPFNNAISNSGAVFVFEYIDGQWVETDYIKASNPDANDAFGWDLSLSGDELVVGARFEDSASIGIDGDQTDNSAVDSGAVYTFSHSSGDWMQTAYIKTSNAEANDQFGSSVDNDGARLVAGAEFEDGGDSGPDADPMDNSVSGAGAAYVFSNVSGQWSQQAYLKADVSNAFDLFGRAVGIRGNVIAVGTITEDSDSIGNGGDPFSNAAPNSGVVYLFHEQDSQWQQAEFIKTSNSESMDVFGWQLALSDVDLISSALLEDSAAQGINGDPINNFAGDSGAVFAYGLFPTYRVAGQVSGLASGNTLLLQNQPSDSLMVTDNGPFVFSRTLLDQEPYQINIVQQPNMPNQVCTSSNESGVITGADVTEIQIDCITVQYTLGGTITGLATAADLILMNDDGQMLTISDNGSFTFAQAIDDGSPFQISIVQQPLDPAQICMLDQQNGTINGADVVNVLIDCINEVYLLGGTLSGLNADGSLTLMNSDGQSLTLTDNGDFTFPMTVPQGSSYQVTVSLQPDDQFCLVQNGGGLVSGEDVTLTVVCLSESIFEDGFEL